MRLAPTVDVLDTILHVCCVILQSLYIHDATGDSQVQSTDALQSTSSVLLQAALQDDQKFALYSTVDPEVIRKKRESKKHQSMKKAASAPNEHATEEEDQDGNSDSIPPPVPTPPLPSDDEEMPNEDESQKDAPIPQKLVSDLASSPVVKSGHLHDASSTQELSTSFEKVTKISFLPEAISSPVSPGYWQPPQTPPEHFEPQQVKSSPQLLVEEEEADSVLLGATSSPTIIVTAQQNMQKKWDERANGSQSSIPMDVKSTPHLISHKSPTAPLGLPTGSSPSVLSPGKQDAHSAVRQRLATADTHTHSSPLLTVQKAGEEEEEDNMHSAPNLLGMGRASLAASPIKSSVVIERDVVPNRGKGGSATDLTVMSEEQHSVGMTIDYNHATGSSMVSPLTSPERADVDGEVIMEGEERLAKEIWQDRHGKFNGQLSEARSQQHSSAWEQTPDHLQDTSQQHSATIQFTVTTMVDPSLLQPATPPTHDTILEDEVSSATSRPGSGGRPPSANMAVRRRKSSSLEDFAKVYYEKFGLKVRIDKKCVFISTIHQFSNVACSSCRGVVLCWPCVSMHVATYMFHCPEVQSTLMTPCG